MVDITDTEQEEQEQYIPLHDIEEMKKKKTKMK